MTTDQREGVSDSQVHVLLTFDDGFWAPAFAVMRSVCLTSKRRRDLVFHLFVQDVSAAHRADLDRIAEEFAARLVYYDISGDKELRRVGGLFRPNKRFPPIVNARLYADRFLPPAVRRIVYLDCDTLVMAPIERLFDHALGDFAMGAVADPFAMFKMGRDMRSRGELYDPADDHFNSGVLLIDIARYAAADIPARLQDFERRGILGRLFYDQDILNLVFKDKWQKLNWRYNVVGAHKAHTAMGVYVVHYVDRRRPWHLFSDVPFHRLYRHVMTNELFYRYARYRWKRSARKLAGRLLGRR